MKFASPLFLMSVLAFTVIAVPAPAEETWSEKAAEKGNDAKRGMKKGANRVGEIFCMEGDVKCAAKKAGNRIEEAGDSVKASAKSVKNKVD